MKKQFESDDESHEREQDGAGSEPFAERFIRYLPDLEGIEGLDLNQNHFLSLEDLDSSPNLGFAGLYSIGNSGHDYLVSCVMPGVAPEQYPIAIFGEEEGIGQVISASVKTWFPSFLIHRLNELLAHYWLCEKTGSLKSAASSLEALESILENRQIVTGICAGFANDGFLGLLEAVFIAARSRDRAAWKYHDFYRVAEGNSAIGRFFALKQRNAPETEYRALIGSSPEYNYPLFEQFAYANEDPHAKRTVVNDKASLPPEIAVEVFSRRLSLDLGNTSSIPKILMIAAKSCREQSEDSPYAELVETLAEHKGKSSDVELTDGFFELGNRLKEEQLFKQAATAYENAVFLSSVESGEFHSAAFDELLDTATHLGDKAYESYLSTYSENVPE